jgi:hypothetical protein
MTREEAFWKEAKDTACDDKFMQPGFGKCKLYKVVDVLKNGNIKFYFGRRDKWIDR